MSCFLYSNEEASSGKVNIDELYDNKKQRDLKQLNIFKKILNRIHNRIRITGRNKRDDRHIWFNVPEYIFGEPLYEKGDCIAYLVTQLQDNGFHVRYIHPNTLFISWNHWVPSYVRSEFKKKTGKLMNEKGEVTDPKKEEVDEDDPNMGLMNPNGMASNTANGNNAKKEKDSRYISIDKYKPTGRFVYNPDLLEKIDKKVHF